jgi:hydrogenase maturation protease
MNRGLVICIGNALVADDGAGQAVYEQLKKESLPENVRLKFLGLGGMDLLEEIDGEDILVVVDGVQLGGNPGTIHLLDWEHLPRMDLRPVSGHGIGIFEAIAVGQRLYPERVPKAIYLVGIEGQCFDQLGKGLTEDVADAIPKAADEVCALLRPLYP